MNGGPCYNCDNRQVGCHCNCDKYLSYRKELDNYNDKVRRIKEKERIAEYGKHYFDYDME